MNELWNTFLTWTSDWQWATFVRAGLVLVVTIILGRIAAAALGRWPGRDDAQRGMLVRRGVFYTIAGLGVLGALRELGFDLSVLLGAAGVLTVAFGFASQTSASNLISGLFLIGERAFGVGDIIRVGTTAGEVLSIDMLSVKLRTFDNLYVRLPNEMLIKSELTNLSRFDLRRIDLLLRVGYGQDLEEVREVLDALATAEPRILEEPKPIFVAQDFEADGVLIKFSVWARREIFVEVRSALQIAVRREFDAKKIAVSGSRMILDGGRI
ncbi:MAG: small-conductance mechanosensitive channel [Polyangiales bacterium]|jgi:small-conductance mechanosensitive channel